jgi:hypothetical protein
MATPGRTDRRAAQESQEGTMSQHQPPVSQSGGWIVQTYVSFAVSLGALALGIAKAVRDQHEASRVVARVDEARFERLIAEHDPFKAPV